METLSTLLAICAGMHYSSSKVSNAGCWSFSLLLELIIEQTVEMTLMWRHCKPPVYKIQLYIGPIGQTPLLSNWISLIHGLKFIWKTHTSNYASTIKIFMTQKIFHRLDAWSVFCEHVAENDSYRTRVQCFLWSSKSFTLSQPANHLFIKINLLRNICTKFSHACCSLCR